MPTFIPGIELNHAFYAEAVRPILNAHFPALVYSAALLGYGSDVLGYDTPQSTDHEWGPRLLLFLAEEDYPHVALAMDTALRHHLPPVFRGYSTAFEAADGEGVRRMVEAAPGAITHHVQLFTVRAFLRSVLGRDPDQPLGALDWLLLPQQQLLELTAGAVFHDGLAALGPLRERLAYYPHDVWLYLLASQWTRIAQEEAFTGRCADVGDELGSRLVAARLVRDLMRLCFLMERRYAPYTKWLGTAFAQLSCAPQLAPALHAALEAPVWQQREQHLARAYEMVGLTHNTLRLTPLLEIGVSPYYSRPYLTPHAGRFAEALADVIHNEEVRAIIVNVGLIGGIDQWADSTDLLDRGDLCTRAQYLYNMRE